MRGSDDLSSLGAHTGGGHPEGVLVGERAFSEERVEDVLTQAEAAVVEFLRSVIGDVPG